MRNSGIWDFLRLDYFELLPIGDSLNGLKDVPEHVYTINATSEDFYVDKFLNILRDAFENVCAVVKNVSENFPVDQKNVLEDKDTSEDFYVDEFLNILLDTFENVCAIVKNVFENFSDDENVLEDKDTSDDFYIDEFLNMLLDAFEDIYTIIPNTSSNSFVDKYVLEDIYVNFNGNF